MARLADPWKWDARGGWYAWVSGSRRRLASFAEGKRVAIRRLAEMTGAADAAAPEVLAVGWVVAKYLENLKHRRDNDALEAGSRRDALRRLADFPDKYLTLPVTDLKPHHVDAWVQTHPDWGPTTRHDAVGAVKACFRWAKRAGHIEADPTDGVEKPKRAKRRELVIDRGQWPAVLAAIRLPQFRDLAEFLFETGARPGEAFRLESRHVDLGKGVAVLGAKEHKSGRKTGKVRAVYLSEKAKEIVGRLAESHPAGPIFLNSRGRAWDRNSVNCQVRGVRARSGVGREFVAYALRHLFATDALDKGVGVETLAKMLGHSDSRMVSTVYSRLDERHDHFREAIEKVRGGEKAEGEAG